MKIGLVGFQGSGKTSVFNSLTGRDADTGAGKKATNRDQIDVPDERVDALAAIYNPKKTTYARVTFVDPAGPADRERKGGGLDSALVSLLRESEALVQVVCAFDNTMLSEPANPAHDIAGFDDELILTDLVQVEKRIARLKKEGQKSGEIDLMIKLQAQLEEGRALRRVELSKEEEASLSGFQFMSAKPLLIVINQSEDAVGQELPDDVKAALTGRDLEAIGMCATLEAEIMAMDADDQAAFLADLGLAESARARFIRAAYSQLDLISMLTSGEDEVRAWTIRRGTIARVAAGKIHSDIERGFIRAEVTAFDDFIELKSETACKEAGKMRLEGKEYVVADGDIVNFRHNS